MAASSSAELRPIFVASQHTSELYTRAVDVALAALDGTVNRSIAKLKLLELGYEIERLGDAMRADCVRRLIRRLAP